MLDLAHLPNPDDRLTYVLGKINRDDNFAEGEALSVFSALAAPGLGGATPRRDFARIIEGSRAMGKAARVPKFVREVTLSTLDEAAAAHRQRNVLTHDRWMHLPWRKTEQWNSPRRQMTPQGPTVTTRTLEEFVACSDALYRVAWRLRSLWIILPAWLGIDDELRDDANPSAERDYWSSIAQGGFKVAANRGDPLDVTVVTSPAAPPRIPSTVRSPDFNIDSAEDADGDELS